VYIVFIFVLTNCQSYWWFWSSIDIVLGLGIGVVVYPVVVEEFPPLLVLGTVKNWAASWIPLGTYFSHGLGPKNIPFNDFAP
jgi:hypothetical protein